MLRAISLALPFAFWASTCWAGNDVACANAMTQSEMNQCAANDYSRADAELNQVYQSLMATLDASRRQQLIGAERAWISYRDAHCHSETAETEGGSMHPLLYDTCLADAARMRAKELRVSLDCQQRQGKCND